MWPTWTDPVGTVHVRNTGTGKTHCGKQVGPYTSAVATRGCDRCVFLDAVESQWKRSR